MQVLIKKTQTVKTETEINVPKYFTTMDDWFYMVTDNGDVLRVMDHQVSIMDANTALKHVEHWVKPCTQDEFIVAYCNAMNQITAASGIEHLPLELKEVTNAY